MLILVAIAAWWLSTGDGDQTASTVPHSSASASAAPGSDTAEPSAHDDERRIPARVRETLELVDAGDWPAAADAPGTRGGQTFRNNEGLLPATGDRGERLRFQEWDVNPKRPGRGRDAERIVTASDGSAWYTLDHYRTFVLIRGPAR